MEESFLVFITQQEGEKIEKIIRVLGDFEKESFDVNTIHEMVVRPRFLIK
ncbi:hypothetical protein [Peribacillus sp. TH24]|nr:hypothetical protein [Peribacillus sp. TH24]MBK5441861.1 hypothetical protein [Peribacillus sp. TH24]